MCNKKVFLHSNDKADESVSQLTPTANETIIQSNCADKEPFVEMTDDEKIDAAATLIQNYTARLLKSWRNNFFI